MVSQTEILPDIHDIICALEDLGIVGQVEVDLDKDFELLAEFTDKSTFANLTGTSNHEGLMGGAMAPLA